MVPGCVTKVDVVLSPTNGKNGRGQREHPTPPYTYVLTSPVALTFQLFFSVLPLLLLFPLVLLFSPPSSPFPSLLLSPHPSPPPPPLSLCPNPSLQPSPLLLASVCVGQSILQVTPETELGRLVQLVFEDLLQLDKTSHHLMLKAVVHQCCNVCWYMCHS